MIEIIVLICITVLGLAYAAVPLVSATGTDDREPPTEEEYVQKLRERRDKQYQGLKDLETERNAGNLGEEEYQKLRSLYLRKAARAEHRLEQMDTGKAEPRDPNLEDRIESEIQKRKEELS